MAFAKSLLGTLFGKNDNNQTAATNPAQQPAQAGLAETSFNESNSAEAKLAWLWREYEHSVQVDGRYSKAALKKFLDQFQEVFNGWQGSDEPKSGSEQQPGKQGSSPMARVQAARGFFSSGRASGCRAGHPAAVLQGLLLPLQQLPNDLSQVVRKQQATVDEMQAVVGVQLLEVILILTQSHANRQRLISFGFLPVLAQGLKAAISRLNTQAAIIGVQDSLHHVQPQLSFLQSLLGMLVAVVNSFASRSLQYCARQSQGAMQAYLSAPAHYCSTDYFQPGSQGQAEQMERIVKPLLDNHLQALLLELLAALQLLRSRGATVVEEWEHLTLKCLLGFVTASRQAQGHMQSRDRDKNGLLMLTGGLGWPVKRWTPTADPQEPYAPEYVIAMPGIRSTQAELTSQLLTLQVIGASIKHNINNLQTFIDANGLARITQLMQWTAFTFPAATQGARQASTHQPRPHSPSLNGSPKGGLKSLQHKRSQDTSADASQSSRDGTSQRAGTSSQQSHTVHAPQHAQHASSGYQHQPHCQKLEELFAVSASWLSMREARKDLPLQDMLMKHLTSAMLGAFRLSDSSSHQGQALLDDPLQSEAIAKLTWDSCALQHYTLRFVSSLLLAEPAALLHLRAEGLWKLAYGKCFFFWGGLASARHATGTHEPQPAPQDPDKAPIASHTLSAVPKSATHSRPSAVTVAETVTLTEAAAAHSTRNASPRSEDALTRAGQAPHPESPRPSQPPADDFAHGEILQDSAKAAGTAEQSRAEEQHSTAGQQRSQATSADAGAKYEALQLLREHVVRVTEAAACLAGLDSNEAECEQLLDLLEDKLEDPAVVLVAASSLGRILHNAQGLTLKALDKQDAISKFANIIKKQKQADAPKAASHTAGHALWQARSAMLTLVKGYLDASPDVQRLAVRKWDIVKALLGLLWEERTQKLALNMVVSLMKVEKVTEDDELSKEPLFSAYLQALPQALQQWKEQGLGMVENLLDGIQKVAHCNTRLHQNLFRRYQCFVQLLNLLNDDYPPEAGAQLCERVLSTMTALLAGNVAAREHLQTEVGYDTLLNIVLRRTASAGPSGGVLRQLLHLVLEGPYHANETVIIANIDAVPLYLRCLRKAAPELQLKGLAVWKKLLQGNMANLSASDRSGVNGELITWFAATQTTSDCQQKLADLLQITGAYSISGRDLRAVLSLLKRQGPNNTPPPAPLLLRTLCTMARHDSPSAFFDFATDSAGILRTTPLQLPTSKGYSFATWLRIAGEVGIHLPGGQGGVGAPPGRALYALLHRSADTKGVIAALEGNRVVVRCMNPKLTEVSLPFQFQSHRWYHVVVAHSTGSALTSSVVRLFVNGNLEASSRFKYAKVAEPLNSCSFAAGLATKESGLGTAFAAFHGQMGCIHLFDDVLNPGQVAALHALGPDYQSIFSTTDCDPLLEQAPAAAALLIHSKEALGPRVMLSYNAQAAAGRMLYNTTDMDGQLGAERDTAAVQEGSQLCCTCHLRDLLHCLGGVSVLLPLVVQLDSVAPQAGTALDAKSSSVVDVIELMAAVLEDSPSNRLTMLQTSGMSLLGYLLQHCSPEHLNAALLHVFESLLRAVTPSEALTKQLLQQLLLNLRLWSSAPADGQLRLQALILKLAKNEPAFFSQLLPIPTILAGVRAHFWESAMPDALKQAYSGALTLEQLRGLRRGLLKVVAVFLKAAAEQQKAVSLDDVQALVSFVGDCPDTELLQDVLQLICELLHPSEPTHRPLLASLTQLGGVQLFMSLVQREQQPLRLMGLRILASFTPLPAQPSPQLSPRATSESEDFVRVSGGSSSSAAALWPALADALLMFPYTKPVRLALLNLLCSQQGLVVQQEQGMPVITAAPVMGIMLNLLLACDDAEERLATLTTLKRLLVEGPQENLAAVTGITGWQEWLLELLLDGSPCLTTISDHPSQPQGRPSSPDGTPRSDAAANSAWEWTRPESQLIRALLRALHGYCVQHQPHGWTAMEQTACHLRSYAARGVVDGHGLLHELIADVMEDLLGRGTASNPGPLPAADSWLTVSSVTSDICWHNAVATLGLVNELLGGCLIAPGGQELHPTAAATAWADKADNLEVDPQAWACIGLSMSQQSGVLKMQQQQWRLGDVTWRLVYTLQKAADTRASLTPQGLISRLAPASAPDPSAKPAAANAAATNDPPKGTEDKLTPASGLGDSTIRLVIRLLLLYVQQAPLERAMLSVKQALALLPKLLDPANELARDRVHMLLAALGQLHAKVAGSKRSKVVETSIGQAASIFKIALASQEQQQTPAATGQLTNIQQVVDAVQPQRMVRAVQLECRCLQHECSRQAAAIQLLEAAADMRRMQERRLEHDFWEVAREALGMICGVEKSRRTAARLAHDEESQGLARQWRHLQRSLTLDRGIWADTAAPHHAHHWKLDKSEDSIRRRMKLKRNYHFMQYSDNARSPSVIASPHAGRGPPDRLLSGLLTARSRMLEEEDPEGLVASPERPSSPAPSSPTSPRGPHRAASLETLDTSLPLSSDTLPDDYREARAAHSQQEQHQVIFTTACELVTPKHVVHGTLKIMQGQLQFTEDMPKDEAPSAAPEGSAVRAKESRTHKSWAIAQICDLHHARYLLQPRALELFLYNHCSALLSFENPKVMRDVVSCIHNITGRIMVMDRKRKLEMAARLQIRWQRWELSNYDYLMKLNTLAGRTFNDLNQYPVFPWVLADYTSASLDLNASATYRDLSKPVGALNEKRRQEFVDRYDSLKEDPDIPPFHYGSHYSSAGTVLFYLIRMEPFTAMNRSLQGGRFDHADRLFSNVAATWDNCLHSSSDVKELTPEFYHQPELLLNSNNFNLGTLQTGVELGDVVLPPWAHNSPDEFIRLQREALESDYVSEHLHEWVDLIFGFKQRGKPAEEACNIFYYLTYEGAVDLDQIQDPTQLKAVEEQIRNFGQTPSQLFKRRHVKRAPPPLPSARPFLNAPTALDLIVEGKPDLKRPNISIASLEVTEGRVVLINADRGVSCHRWLALRTDTGAFTFGSAVPEVAYAVEAEPAPPRMLGTPFAADLESRHCFATLPGGRTVVCCGYWDNTIRCYTTDDGRLLQSLHQHKDIVTCIAAGSDSRTVVSGSRDTTLVIWDAAAPVKGTKAKQKGAVTLVLKERPRHVLYGHADAVVCLAVCTELDLVVSASADGSLLFHTLLDGRYTRCLSLPGNVPPQLLAIAPGPGILLAHSWQTLAIHAYTINGRHIATVEGTERLSAFAVSADGRFLLCGGVKGVITLRWIHSLQVVHRYDAGHAGITTLAVTSEDCFLAGCQDGYMLAFAPRPQGIHPKFNLGAAPMQSTLSEDSKSPSQQS